MLVNSSHSDRRTLENSNREDLGIPRVRRDFGKSKWTLAEAKEASGLSLNTVRRILEGDAEKAHPNSILKLQRALDSFFARQRFPGDVPDRRSDQVAIIPDGSSLGSAEQLAKSLAKCLQSLAIEPPQVTKDSSAAVDRIRHLLIVADSNLQALTPNGPKVQDET